MRKRTVRRLRTIGGWILVVIVIIFVAEWVSRGLQDKLMDPAENPHLAFDPLLGHVYKPHYTQDIENPAGNRLVIDINSLGLRDREVTGRKSGEVRIVGLGDSFTAATQVNQSDTYLRQMEALAEAAGQSALWTVNAGIDGYNLVQSHDLLRRYAETLDPDIVLLAVYVGNDIQEYSEPRGLAVPGKSFFRGKSYLYHLLKRGYHRIKGGKTPPGDVTPDQLERWRRALAPFGEPPDDETIERFVRNAKNEISIFRGDGISPAARSGTEDVLRRIQDCARMEDAKMVIVLLPTQLQVAPMDLVKASALLDFGTEDFDLGQPQKVLMEIADRLEIPALDLLPWFRSHPSPESLYFEGYRYWNGRGHGLAAQVIYGFLAEGGYVQD